MALKTAPRDLAGARIIVIAVVASALIFFMMGLAYKRLQRLSEENKWVYHSQEVTIALSQLYANLKDIETARRDFIITRDLPVAKTDIAEKQSENRTVIARLSKLVADNISQTENLAKLKTLINEDYSLVSRTLEEKNNLSEADSVQLSLLAAKAVMPAISTKIREMQHAENTLLEQRRNIFLTSERWVPVYLYVISLFSLAMLAFAFYRIFRNFKIQQSINDDLRLKMDTLDLAEKIGRYGVWTYDSKSKNYTFSKNFYNIIRRSADSFSDAVFRLSDNIHSEDRPVFRNAARSWLRGEQSGPFELRYQGDNGAYRYLNTITDKISFAGNKNQIIGITQDVTLENQNRSELANANISLKYYNQSSEEAEKIGKFGFWRWKVQDDAYWFSDNLYRLFGTDASGTHTGFEDFLPNVHPEDRNLVIQKIAEMHAGKEVDSFSHRIYTADTGQLKYISITPRRFEDAGHSYYLVIAKDITEEVLDKKNLEEQNRILDAKNKELEAFNYVASHDLQEPLRKIEMFISRLIAKDFDNISAGGRQYLQKTSESAARMRRLIDDLLQFSRTSRGENIFKTCDLNAILTEAKDELQNALENSGGIIISEKLPEIQAVPFQIKQLFVNLIGNSLKYAKPDEKPEIRISTAYVSAGELPKKFTPSQNKYMKISFQDNGIGFEAQYTDKIFHLFTRLHGKHEFEGTGIGLAICRKIVENHHGFILAEGQPGNGAKFEVYLPENQ